MLRVPNLPTLDRLNATVAPDLDVAKVAAAWMGSFASLVEAGDVDGIVGLFIEESHWRDMLALTWDFRTFHGVSDIQKFLSDRLAVSKLANLRIKEGSPVLLRPYADLAWINIMFDFETHVGLASGVVRLVPMSNGDWKAHCMYTNLEDLKGFPEQIGSLRNHAPNHGRWEQERQQAVSFQDENPVVIIIGGGHSGLDLAARLKCLGVRALVIEKNPRIGDNWRNRYEALCLHDPVWYDHLPYLPFPPTWPVYTPALKLGNWLEHYAEAMELNVWTSSTVKSARPNAAGTWDVVIAASGAERRFTVKHVVFATGLGGGEGKLPSYPGMETFKGKILHSTEHKRATDHAGKKVVIVGACTSAHDIAVDYYEHGVDVTMYQRSSTHVLTAKNGLARIMKPIYWEGGPPTEVADRLNASFPHLMSISLNQRQARVIAEDDKYAFISSILSIYQCELGNPKQLGIDSLYRDLLDGLRKRGFKLNMGMMDAGFAISAWNRGGGFYIDVGASQMIIDGKIKLKNDSQIAVFNESGLKFEDGSELAADVVVFATGLGNARDGVRKVCGDAVGDKCKPIWGLNEEGEINGAWRDLGVPGLWYMIGNLALCRFHSKHVALQIKAIEEGVFGARYEAE
ncbi:Flavin-containing monooxygenase [Mycena sanguinolenta]|uniref:Flavin-containing monooxygenase n=1 Tax=Mycena sanguinolenta TaxID=230812 RepID=A0A8H6ZKU8_9AGAR|nr:Flavin-containing monooxygenase [Mycena sanguinolenta]